jgi:hypothetical protein
MEEFTRTFKIAKSIDRITEKAKIKQQIELITLRLIILNQQILRLTLPKRQFILVAFIV